VKQAALNIRDEKQLDKEKERKRPEGRRQIKRETTGLLSLPALSLSCSSFGLIPPHR
jgi:hypothetical protein